ncbi:hypothetical protein [Streptomyces roseoverticillatus]|uniref:hypothetical protein n=1 Tax=Streptomyces roseoverticillatus TaxID=66429 RepID=UPI0004BFED22|nr:hypothetical protein [Streptomyces roseoverticillatus]
MTSSQECAQAQLADAPQNAAPEAEAGQHDELSQWCLRCAQLRVRFHGAVRLGRITEAQALNAEFVRHQQVVHS